MKRSRAGPTAFATARGLREDSGGGGDLSATSQIVRHAALGYLPPVAGALFQEAIDLAVILNPLRALRG